MMIMDDDVHDGDDDEDEDEDEDDDDDDNDDDDDEQDEELARLILTRQFGRIHLETYVLGFPVRHYGLDTAMSVAFFSVYRKRGEILVIENTVAIASHSLYSLRVIF